VIAMSIVFATRGIGVSDAPRPVPFVSCAANPAPLIRLIGE
jgi:hypothetical protein